MKVSQRETQEPIRGKIEKPYDATRVVALRRMVIDLETLYYVLLFYLILVELNPLAEAKLATDLYGNSCN